MLFPAQKWKNTEKKGFANDVMVKGFFINPFFNPFFLNVPIKFQRPQNQVTGTPNGMEG